MVPSGVSKILWVFADAFTFTTMGSSYRNMLCQQSGRNETSLVPRPSHFFFFFSVSCEKSGRPGRSGDVIRHDFETQLCISAHSPSYWTSSLLQAHDERCGWVDGYMTASQTTSDYITWSTRPSKFSCETLGKAGYKARVKPTLYLCMCVCLGGWGEGMCRYMYFTCVVYSGDLFWVRWRVCIRLPASVCMCDQQTMKKRFVPTFKNAFVWS